MNPTPLFRTAAIQAQQVKWLSDIVLVRPLSFFWLTSGAMGLALLIIAFLALGSYTKRSSVAGQLVPDTGMVKIYAPQGGIVVQKSVGEGKVVQRGETLFIISSERQSNNDGAIQASISRQVAERQKSLHDELTQTHRVQQEEDSAMRKKIDGLLAEQKNIARQLLRQQTRVGLAEEAVKRAGQLQVQGFISHELMQQKQADLLDQYSRSGALERDQINVGRELMAQRDELASLPLRQLNQLAQIKRMLISTDQEWTESEAKRHLSISTPESGIATAVAAELGQTVDGAKPLLSIVPRGAVLQAFLYVPSRAVGFIRPNDRVLLRYQAFPFQKFGHAEGTVMSVSRTALPTNELTGIPVTANGEPLYRVTVQLARQTLIAYGKPQPLQAGMLVDADVLQEKRRLYEWVLEPLYSLTGKL